MSPATFSPVFPPVQKQPPRRIKTALKHVPSDGLDIRYAIPYICSDAACDPGSPGESNRRTRKHPGTGDLASTYESAQPERREIPSRVCPPSRGEPDGAVRQSSAEGASPARGGRR